MSTKDQNAFTEYNIIQWIRWVRQTDDEMIQGMRMTRIENHLYPDGISDDEREKRERAVERAHRKAGDGEGEQFKSWPEPFPPPGETFASAPEQFLRDPPPTKTEMPPWQGLISRHSKAYRRGSIHDGTLAEQDAMRQRAYGSPFEADDPEPVKKPDKVQEEALARRNREIARRQAFKR